jgi:imidazole glycerol-phosphate synthase subunit HisH
LKTVGILDYGLGNIRSVEKTIIKIGLNPVFVSTLNDFNCIDALIIPGVGTFSEAMKLLQEKSLISLILDFAESGKKIVGICLGMQILADRGSEILSTEGLALIPGRVEKIPNNSNNPIPHLGWNNVSFQNQDNPLEQMDFYFIHSYHFIPESDDHILCKVNYGLDLVAGVRFNNIYGLQFHPEKSQNSGLEILKTILSA